MNVKISWLVSLTLLSLGANVFLLGTMVGHHFERPSFAEGPDMPPPGIGGLHDMLTHLERLLPPDDARIFDDEMRQDLPAPDKGRAEFETLIKGVHEALQAPEFSPDAFAAAVQKMHDQRTKMDADFAQAMTRAAGKISPAGRRSLAASLPDHPPGPPDHNPEMDRGSMPPPPDNRE